MKEGAQVSVILLNISKLMFQIVLACVTDKFLPVQYNLLKWFTVLFVKNFR